MRKSPDAFRTISEVAQDLDLPQHVLRFWETRFSQIKPMKRGGGRRYYRPDDIDLLKGIRHLLYDEGYTIKGVQRILKEQGVRHVIDTVSDGDGFASEDTVLTGAEPAAPHPQDFAEPNQLEISRPPLIAPSEAPVPTAPHASMASVGAVHPAETPHVPHQMALGSHGSAAIHNLHQTASPNPALQNTEIVQTPAPVQRAVAVAQPAAYHGVNDSMLQQPAPLPTQQEMLNVEAPTIARATQSPSSAPVEEKGEVVAPKTEHTRQVVKPSEPQTSPQVPVPAVENTPLPQGLVDGEPKFVSGQSASVSVSDGISLQQDEHRGNGLLNRLRGRLEEPQRSAGSASAIGRDDIRRLQSTLFELLECKRILDQARTGE